MLIDTHAHINYLSNPDDAVWEAYYAEVEKIIVPSAAEADFDAVIALAEKYEGIYGALGIHPSELSSYSDETMNKIVELSKNSKIKAIGEIGLDYYWDSENLDKKAQQDAFRAQLDLANALNLPVLIHDREAHFDTFNILKEMGSEKVIMHCFSGSAEFMKECVKEGFYIALGGVVTFKNAKKMKEVALEVPLSHLMLETDCPYLTPHPFRGEENSPKYLPLIAKEIANIKDITYDEVVEVTSKNAMEFFGI